MRRERSIYRSERGREAVLEWYAASLNPVLPRRDRIEICTDWGRTHLFVVGDKAAPPLVHLHGLNMNSAAMAHTIATLARIRRVYAIDIIGTPGHSAGTRPWKRGSGYARWLVQVLDMLKLRQPEFVGYSFGGWLILKLASFAPKRIGRAVLVTPCGLVRHRVWPSLKAAAIAVPNVILARDKDVSRSMQVFYGKHQTPEPNMMKLFGLLYEHTWPDLPVFDFPLFSRRDLAGWKEPVQVILGGDDRLYEPDPMRRRAEKILTNLAETVVLPGEGHLFSADGWEIAHQHMAGFLER